MHPRAHTRQFAPVQVVPVQELKGRRAASACFFEWRPSQAASERRQRGRSTMRRRSLRKKSSSCCSFSPRIRRRWRRRVASASSHSNRNRARQGFRCSGWFGRVLSSRCRCSAGVCGSECAETQKRSAECEATRLASRSKQVEPLSHRCALHGEAAALCPATGLGAGPARGRHAVRQEQVWLRPACGAACRDDRG